MRFSEIIGQDAQVSLLAKALVSGRLPHSVLLHGPDGVGKATVGRVMASAIQCSEMDGDACGSCLACRKIEHGNHPDFFHVTRLPKKSARGRSESDLSQFIVVDQIRELAEHAAYAPKEGMARVFMIDPADAMNTEAQNALLKTLEEPPGKSILVLISSRPYALLPTVRSRCLAVRFDPVPSAVLSKFLRSRGVPPDETEARAALSGGRPGLALELDLAAMRARREELLADMEALTSSRNALADLSDMSARLIGKEMNDLLEGLELCQGMLRDAALSAAGTSDGTLLNIDISPRIARLGADLGSARAAALVETIETLRSAIRFNVNKNSLADAFMAAMAGAPPL